MGNLPTFSAFLFFEVEIATDYRHFRPELIEIAKRVKDTKMRKMLRNKKKHKCMGNLPTFSAFLFFEVEVATDNRRFRLERIDISKRSERHKKRARC